MSSFNTVLKDLRKSRNLSQTELANKMGISRSTIAMYESGSREPDFETMEAIADFFNVDMNELYGNKKVSDNTTISDSELKAAFWGGERDLSQDEMDALWDDVRDYAAFKASQKRREREKGNT